MNKENLKEAIKRLTEGESKSDIEEILNEIMGELNNN